MDIVEGKAKQEEEVYPLSGDEKPKKIKVLLPMPKLLGVSFLDHLEYQHPEDAWWRLFHRNLYG